MATNVCWRVIWCYNDASGKPLTQFPEMAADFIANVLPVIPGGDGTTRPDPNDLQTRIANNFPVPAGATIVLRLVSSSQVPVVYS